MGPALGARKGAALVAAARRTPRSVLALAAVLVLPVVLLALLAQGGAKQAQAAAVTIDVGSDWFCNAAAESPDPNVYCTTTINVGDTVTWHRVGGTHNVVECGTNFSKWSDPDGACNNPDWASPMLNAGAADWSRTFNTPGTHFYACELHWPAQKGKLVVQAASTPTPTPSPTPTAVASQTPAPSPTPTSSPRPTAPASPTPAPKPTPGPSLTPTPAATPTPLPALTPSPLPSPTATIGPSPPAPSSTPLPGAKTVNVSIGEYFFDPDPLIVNMGDTVVWTNQGARPHTTTSDDGYWDSGIVKPGHTFSFTATGSGTFHYHCELHAGHEATVIALGKAPPPPPAPPPPQPSPSPAAAGTGGQKADVIVEMTGSPHAYTFKPEPVTISVGQSIAWRNTTTFIHTATADENGPDGWPAWDTGDVAPGQVSAPIRFGKAGKFTYYCVYHAEQVGTVLVGAAGAAPSGGSAAAPATPPPPTSAPLVQQAPVGQLDLKLGAPAGTQVSVAGSGVDRDLAVSLVAGAVLGLAAIYALWRRRFVM